MAAVSQPPLEIYTTYEELQAAVESLLAAAFAAQDEEGRQDIRERELEYIENRLAERNLDFDVEELYNRLVRES